MTSPKRPGSPRRAPGRGQPTGRRPSEFWAAVPESAIPDPIEPAADPTALLRSLGAPPLIPGSERQVAVVMERASMLATALAMAANVLAPTESSD